MPVGPIYGVRVTKDGDLQVLDIVDDGVTRAAHLDEFKFAREQISGVAAVPDQACVVIISTGAL